MRKGKRLLVAAISGVNAKGALERFASYTLSQGKKMEPMLCINDVMAKQFANRFEPLTWHEILTYPYDILSEIWKESFKSILDTLRKNPGLNFVVNIHSCYYHQFTRETVSLVNLKLLGDLQPDAFVTLIDDLDDIHARLKAPKALYSMGLGGAADNQLSNFKELDEILHWRAAETMFSRYYASQLGLRHSLVATKHRPSVLYKLLFEAESSPRVYLSHPISKVRRLLIAGKHEDAQKAVEPIEALTEYLSKEYTCFAPTTIDEFRLVPDGTRVKYSPRWAEKAYATESSSENRLFDPVQKTCLPYRNPSSGNAASDGGPETESIYSDSEFLQAVKRLNADITQQIGIRDKILVEQSDFLFCYRPYLNGPLSSGVETEVQYIGKLRGETGKKLGVVFFPDEDMRDAIVYQVATSMWSPKLSLVLEASGWSEEECRRHVVEKNRDEIIHAMSSKTKLASCLADVFADLRKHSPTPAAEDPWGEKALDPQRAGKFESAFAELAGEIIEACTRIKADLEEHFVVCGTEDECRQELHNMTQRQTAPKSL